MTERLNNVSVVKPIVIGTYAFLLQQGASDKAASMYRWTVCLRSAEDPHEDLSYYIRNVEFTLHNTFTQPRRTIDHPPYEVTEVGWGEFEINVKVFFHDSQERSVELRHFLKLRPDHDLASQPGFNQTITPVVKETYEQIIFQNPHEWFYEKLIRPPNGHLPPSPLEPFFGTFEDEQEFEELTEIHHFLRRQIAMQSEALMLADNEYRAQKELMNRSANAV